MEQYIILLLAIVGPVIGSLLGISLKISSGVLYGMMAFAGGTMLYISLFVMLPESIYYTGIVGAVLGVIIGMLLLESCEMLLFSNTKNMANSQSAKTKLSRVAIMSMLAIFVHNLPEGFIMAINLAAGQNEKALAVAFAIALHDIPEGYCTSAPYYYSTNKKFKAFMLSVSTIIPVIIGFYLGQNLYSLVSGYTLGSMNAVAVGMMVWVSVKELLPVALQDGNFKTSFVCALIGVAVALVIN